MSLFSTAYVKSLPDQEKAKWTLLRSMEWARFPMFATQPLVPLLLFVPWFTVFTVVLVASWVWLPFRHKFVSLPAAEASATLSHLKILTSIGVGAWLFWQGQDWLQAGVALLWPFVVLGMMSITPPGDIGKLQRDFAVALFKAHGEF